MSPCARLSPIMSMSGAQWIRRSSPDAPGSPDLGMVLLACAGHPENEFARCLLACNTIVQWANLARRDSITQRIGSVRLVTLTESDRFAPH